MFNKETINLDLIFSCYFALKKLTINAFNKNFIYTDKTFIVRLSNLMKFVKFV